MASRMKIQGAMTALVTPFTEDGSAVDYEALEKLVERQIAEGINGLVPVGTTGETPTVSTEEHAKIVQTVVKVANKRVPVIAGTGSNSTDKTVETSKKAKELGADALLVVNPYYNKPTQKGLIAHFKAVASVGLPIVLYNIPGRCGTLMTPATVAQLYNECPEIVAIKEATGNMDQASEIMSLCDIQVVSGDDSLTLPLMAMGGTGVISVLSNLSPKRVLGVTDNVLKGDFAAARKAHIENFAVAKAMFAEVNPQPIKKACQLAGIIPTDRMRLPMVSVEPETAAKVEAAMKSAGLL
mmetsp:Transcript_10765/g.25720  ORF Transcript_10765/g.25720 Transcript_10765/m.25720 type:complete len:297 (+) Transcript_10765:54-944(+)